MPQLRFTDVIMEVVKSDPELQGALAARERALFPMGRRILLKGGIVKKGDRTRWSEYAHPLAKALVGIAVPSGSRRTTDGVCHTLYDYT